MNLEGNILTENSETRFFQKKDTCLTYVFFSPVQIPEAEPRAASWSFWQTLICMKKSTDVHKEQHMNEFKRRLRSGERLIGYEVDLCDPCISEMVGMAGFDYIWIDSEHSAMDYQTGQRPHSRWSRFFRRHKGISILPERLSQILRFFRPVRQEAPKHLFSRSTSASSD